MYIPAYFRESNQERIFEFIEENNFAALVSFDGEKPLATHLVLRIAPDSNEKLFLEGHMARANAQWQTFNTDKEILAIFSGAHSYISPRWYPEPDKNVPTWNYQSIHVYGKPQIIESESELRGLLERLVGQFENGTDYKLENLPADYFQKLMRGIVGFRIEVTRIEAAFKLSQHRPETHPGVIAGLTDNADENSLAIAEAMRQASQPQKS